MIQRLVAVLAGVWLMFSPAVLGYGDPAAANDRILGPLAASLAFVAIWEVARPLRWATLPAGMWLVAAPLVLGYEPVGAVISTIAAGVVIAATAPFGGKVDAEHGGGWSVLFRHSSDAGPGS